MAASIRLLPFAIADGPHNMAADEVLLDSAANQGSAALRFYSWSTATVSLGYFQPAQARLAPGLASLPWVRRPTGGATLVHHHEVTYALAIPPGPDRVGESWMRRMHLIIADALLGLGVRETLPLVEEPSRHGDVLCFQQLTPGDLVCRGAKIVGSAQRKKRRALLQHGGILLARSPHTPQLAGLHEVTGVTLPQEQVAEAVTRIFGQMTRCLIAPGDWSEEERRRTAALVAEKYGAKTWNERR
jgi:lipoate-protein ligase A